jgi:hypothetical protein
MKPVNQSDQEMYRLIVVRHEGSEILFETSGPGLSLPRVGVFPQRRIAHQLTSELDKQLGIRACCLFVPPFSRCDGTNLKTNYVVMESISQNGRVPTGTCWMPRMASPHQGICPADDSEAIAESLLEMDSYAMEAKRGPFGRPGWLRELSMWAQEQLSPLGFSLSGDFQQFDAGPTFSLVRLGTDGAAVWFKATGRPNLHELPITLCLARLFPVSLPPILGIHPTWNGWLSEEVSDTTLDQCKEPNAWETAAKALAELQIASIGKTCALLDVHCKDLRYLHLTELVPAFIARMAELMAKQIKEFPPPLTDHELDFLGERLHESLAHLQTVGLPDTLGHADINPGNVLVAHQRCVFLDWAEACVANPILTFEYLREHRRRAGTNDARASIRIATAYLRPWESLISPDDLAQALTVSPLLAVFVHAIASDVWRSAAMSYSTAQAAYFRSLTRRMFREAMSLSENGERANSQSMS